MIASLSSKTKQARRIGEARHEASVIQQRQESKNVSLDNLFEQMKQGEMKDLNVIIKGDVQGSVEALFSYENRCRRR